MKDPNFMQALLYLIVAALLGGLMVWLWLRLRLQELQETISQQKYELVEQKALAQNATPVERTPADYQIIRDQLTLLKEQESQWKLNLQLQEKDRKSLEEWRNKAEQAQKELQHLRATVQKTAGETASPLPAQEWEARLAKSEKARKELQEEVAETAKREARWHQEISDMQAKVEQLTRQLNAKSSPEKAAQQENTATPIVKSANQEIIELQEPTIAPKAEDEEVATLARIKERAKELNFDRMGLASPEKKDDLQKIKGIGPFSERKLNSIGIFTYAQLSRLESEDQDKLNEVIEFFPGRIKRDQWVLQAENLLKKG